ACGDEGPGALDMAARPFDLSHADIPGGFLFPSGRCCPPGEMAWTDKSLNLCNCSTMLCTAQGCGLDSGLGCQPVSCTSDQECPPDRSKCIPAGGCEYPTGACVRSAL